MRSFSLRRWSIPSIDRRTLLGVGLAAVAAILVLGLTRPPDRTAVLVADGDVPAGIPLSQVDLGVRLVTDAEGFVVGNDIGQLADWTVAIPVNAGEPLTPSVLRAPVAGPESYEMALSLPAAQAVQGRIVVGDTVDIYATYDQPGADPHTELVAEAVSVISAPGAANDRDTTVHLVIGVDADMAAALARAVHTAEIDLVRRPAR